MASIPVLVTALALILPAFMVDVSAPDGAAMAAASCAGVSVGCAEWVATYNAPGTRVEQASAVATSDAAAFVVGWTEPSYQRDDAVTAAFDLATGAALWTARLDGPGSGIDRAVDVAYSEGAVYVVGQAKGASSGADAFVAAYDAKTGATRWVTYLDGSAGSEDYGRAIAVSPDATRVYVAAQAWGTMTGADAFVAALEAATGAELWRAQEDSGAQGDDDAVALVADGDGVVVAGHFDLGTLDVFARAYSPAGALRWSATHDGGFDERATSVALAADGAVFVAGRVSGAAGQDNYLTVAFDDGGAERWSATYNGPNNFFDVAVDVGVSHALGLVVVTGESYGTNYDFATLAYDVDDGTQVWLHRWNGVGNHVDRPRGLALTDASAYVVGESYSGASTTFDVAAVGIDLATGATLFAATDNGPANQGDYGRAVAVAGDRVIAAGTSRGVGTSDDLLVTSFDATDGGRAWAARHNEPGAAEDVALAAVGSPDGSVVYITGRSAFGNPDALTVAMDAATGATLWEARYDHGSWDYGESVAVSPDGTRLFVTGRSIGTGWDYATLAYDTADGTLLWSARYSASASTDEPAEVVTDGARVFVTGRSFLSPTGWDVATVAYDAATGAQLWAARYHGPTTNGADHGAAIALSGTRVVVAGESNGGTGFGPDYLLVAYDAETGAQEWVSRYSNSASTDQAYDVASSPDGTFVVATGRSVGSSYDAATVALDAATGATLWTARYSAGFLSDEGYAVAVSPDGATVAVAGTAWLSGSGQDLLTLAYDAATGAEKWIARSSGPGSNNDHARHVRFSPDSERLYVAGDSRAPSTLEDQVLLAYDVASGKGLWGARANAPGNGVDTVNALIVSPDGQRIIVAGQGQGAGTGADYVARAYTALAPPAAPQDLAAAAGPGAREVTLSWSAPQVDGGKPVDEYRVYRDGLLVATLPATATTHVDATPDDAAHDYSVTAVNAIGEGPAATVVAQPHQLPGAPENVRAAPHGIFGEVEVAWDAPASDGGMPLIAYHVERLEGGAWTRIATLGADETAHVDADRMPATTYRYRVLAENAVGEGAASSEACAVASPWPEALPCAAPEAVEAP